MRIAMVCLGNICRSPMAEEVARARLEACGLAERVSVESFGTAGYHQGEGADPRTDAVLARRGYPSGRHRARKISAADLASADLVLCADRSNLSDLRRLGGPGTQDKIRLLRSFDPQSPEGAEVPDPWYGGDADFDATLDLVERSIQGLIEYLLRESD